MGDIDVKVSLDAKQFVEQLEQAARQTMNALRRSVDRSARAARKSAIVSLASDIGVPKSQFAKAVPPVKGSTQGNLSASWTVSKARISALKVGAFTPVMSELRGSYAGSTFRLTGGGSSSLNVPKSFVMKAPNGATLLMVRHGKDIKSVYAESPKTGMGQSDGGARACGERRERNASGLGRRGVVAGRHTIRRIEKAHVRPSLARLAAFGATRPRDRARVVALRHVWVLAEDQGRHATGHCRKLFIENISFFDGVKGNQASRRGAKIRNRRSE